MRNMLGQAETNNDLFMDKTRVGFPPEETYFFWDSGRNCKKTGRNWFFFLPDTPLRRTVVTFGQKLATKFNL